MAAVPTTTNSSAAGAGVATDDRAMAAATATASMPERKWRAHGDQAPLILAHVFI